MADDLGRAELKIVVDDSQAKTQLGALKTAIEGFNPQFKGVNRQLFAVADSAEKAKLKVQSLNQVLSQAPGASYGKISAQISRLSTESRNLQIASEAYLKTLTRISELEFVRNARAGRQRATADFEAVRGATLTRGFGAAERLPSLPPTIAGDVQRIRELNFQLRNLEVGSTAFEITQRRLESTQRRVAEATDRVTRAIRSQTAAQREGFGAFSRSISEPSFLAGTPDTGAISKSIERNRVKAAQLAERRNAQLDALDADLARIRERRNAAELRALQIGAAPQRRGLVQGGVQRLLGEPLPVPPLPSGFFPGRIQAAQRRRQDITSNALIGGAFPLLFGQGLGASLGGAAGGGLGGAVGGQFGFGLSLLGTAVGAQFDAIIQKATLLGQALDNPIKNFDALRQSALLSSKALERQVQFLISSGREAEAAALIQQDLARSYGSAENARELAEAQDKLNRSWAQLSAGLAVLGLEPIANSAESAANALAGLRRVIDFFAGLRPPGLSTDAAGPFRPFFEPGSPGIGAAAIGSILVAIGRGGAAGGAGGGATAAEDAQVAKTAAIQKEIEATQTRRLAIQKQLAGATGDENTATAQAAKAQDAILGIREAQLQAANKLRALPASASLEEFNAAIREARADIEKARIEFEKLVSAQNNAARLLKRDVDVRERTTGLAPSARREAELAAGLTRARAEYDKAKAQTQAAIAADSEQGTEATQKAVKAAEAAESAFGQAWRSARQDVADYNAELAFTIQRQEQINALNLAAVRRQLTDAQALAEVSTPQGISTVRDTLSRRQQIQESITAARARERDIADQLSTARLRGDDAEITRLVGEQEAAAEQTKLALVTGSTALRDAAQQLRESAIETQRSFENLRGGNLEFLTSSQQESLLVSLRNQAAPEAARRGINLTRPGSTRESQIGLLNRFLNFTRSESQLIEQGGQIATAQEIADRPLIISNERLGTSLNALTTSVNNLSDKDWSVQVNVNGTSGATVIGDVAGALV